MPGSKSTDEYIHVVAAIVWHPVEYQTLLISRRLKGKHLQHLWELPGGKKEAGESRQRALARELKEEIDISPIDSKAFMQVKHQYNDRNILLDVWTVSTFSGKAKGLEGQEIRWVSINNLAEFKFPDADKPILNAIKNSAIA